MNKKPVYYFQTDTRWKNEPYRTSVENSTVGQAGCGPSCAAMLIETLTGKIYTPLDACRWSMAHGYKATGQGTYYAYFVSQFKEFGIECRMLNNESAYGKSNSTVHKEAFDLLQKGYYLIACMGKGLWTSSGHFIVVWWKDDNVHINDPASEREERINGDLATFKSQVKYYWAIDATKYNKKPVTANSPIADIKEVLNSKYIEELISNGRFNVSSKKAIIKAMQIEINKNYGGKLTVDGICGKKTQAACPTLKMGSKGNMVCLLQLVLCTNGYKVDVDSYFGTKTFDAIQAYQKENEIKVDGVVGPITWTSLVR